MWNKKPYKGHKWYRGDWEEQSEIYINKGYYEKDGVVVIEFVPLAEGEKRIIRNYYKNDVEIKENE